MAQPVQLSFQDAASPVMEELLYLHDHAMMIVFLISAFVLFLFPQTMMTMFTDTVLADAHLMEAIWTILPAVVLILIAIPSIRILYIMDELTNPHLTIKAIGHQWYWSYEYTDFKDLSFDSYMVQSEHLSPGSPRLLEVDTHMVMPINSLTRMLITSEDVLHSWALPAMGVKVDAIPGRLNQTTMTAYHPGLFYGQCSEICGANHSFMPIVMEAVPLQDFETWSTMM